MWLWDGPKSAHNTKGSLFLESLLTYEIPPAPTHWHSSTPISNLLPLLVLWLCAWVLSRVQLFATPWTVACQAPLSMGFSRQEHWSGLLFPSPGDLSNPSIESTSPASPVLAGRFFYYLSHQGSPIPVPILPLFRLWSPAIPTIGLSLGTRSRSRKKVKSKGNFSTLFGLTVAEVGGKKN